MDNTDKHPVCRVFSLSELSSWGAFGHADPLDKRSFEAHHHLMISCPLFRWPTEKARTPHDRT
jgi:hypothetical protein